MRSLAKLLTELDTTTATTAKVDALVRYFGSVNVSSAPAVRPASAGHVTLTVAASAGVP